MTTTTNTKRKKRRLVIKVANSVKAKNQHTMDHSQLNSELEKEQNRRLQGLATITTMKRTLGL